MTQAATKARAARRPCLGDRAGLWVLGLSLVSAAAMRGVFNPLQQAAQVQLGLSDVQVGLVQGLAASLPAAVISLPLGRLVDRTSRARLMVLVALVWTAGTFITAVASNFAGLYIGRMLAGAGAICALPISISMAADLAAPERRGRALLFISLGANVGTALAFALAGWAFGVLHAQGLSAWRTVQLVFGAASAVLVLPLLLLREPARHEVGEAASAPFAGALREAWTYRGLLIPLILGEVGVIMGDSAAAVWAAPLLTRQFGLRPEQFAGWMSLVILVPGVLGAVLGGFAADWSVKARPPGGVLAGAVIASILALPGAAFSIAPGVGAFAGLLSLLLFCGSVSGLVTSTAIAQLVPNEIRGLCLGVLVVASSLLGFGLAPSLAPVVENLLGGHRLGAALALLDVSVGAASCLGFVAAAFALRGSSPHRRP